jgi:hypothetical protein
MGDGLPFSSISGTDSTGEISTTSWDANREGRARRSELIIRMMLWTYTTLTDSAT